jgi:hypothetical protein
MRDSSYLHEESERKKILSSGREVKLDASDSGFRNVKLPLGS